MVFLIVVILRIFTGMRDKKVSTMFKRIKEALKPTPKTKENRDDKSEHRKYTTRYEDLCQ